MLRKCGGGASASMSDLFRDTLPGDPLEPSQDIKLFDRRLNLG